MDVTDDALMQAGVEAVLTEQGRIDVLVNAGCGSYGALEDVPTGLAIGGVGGGAAAKSFAARRASYPLKY